MSETISRKRGRTVSTNDREKQRMTWYPALQPMAAGQRQTEYDWLCEYCGCSMAHHGGRVMQYPVGKSGRRMNKGARLVHCRACAAAMDTDQVVCYAAPGVFR